MFGFSFLDLEIFFHDWSWEVVKGVKEVSGI